MTYAFTFVAQLRLVDRQWQPLPSELGIWHRRDFQVMLQRSELSTLSQRIIIT